MSRLMGRREGAAGEGSARGPGAQPGEGHGEALMLERAMVWEAPAGAEADAKGERGRQRKGATTPTHPHTEGGSRRNAVK